MKKVSLLLISTALGWSSLAGAGVSMEMVTRNMEGGETDRIRMSAQDGKVRIEDSSEPSSAMIYLGDRFAYVDHDKRSYYIVDEAMLEDAGNQMSAAMKQMEEQLASMPPEQRAMVEQMMKGRLQDMMPAEQAAKPVVRIERNGSGDWQGTSCKQFAVYQDEKRTQDVCVADLDDIEGSDEVMSAFRSMAAYMSKLMEAMPMIANKQPNPTELMDRLDGFPVTTVDYDGGEKSRITTLDKVDESSLDGALFEIPEGYRPMR